MILSPYIFGGKILDGYSVSVAYALFKLRTAYTGFAVRVRSETALAQGDVMFDSNDEVSMNSNVTITAAGTSGLSVGAVVSLTTFCNSGGANQSAYIRTWYDQSGNGIDVFNLVTANQPRLVNVGILETKNSKAAIRFLSANSTILSITTMPSAILDGAESSYFVVGASETANTFTRVVSAMDNAPPTGQWTVALDRSANKRNFAIVNSAGTAYYSNMGTQLDNNNYRLLSGFINSSKQMSSYVNGVGGAGDTYVSPYTLDQNFAIGGRADGLGQYVDGPVGPVIILNGDESANRTTIENKLNTYYNIY